MGIRRFCARAAVMAAVFALAGSTPVWGQKYAPAESVTVTPGAQFKAGALHRRFFGAHYRDLWVVPLRVPVLNLSQFAGGLKPTRQGGGQQTKSLRLEGGDGREYQFRSLSKDPVSTLPPELRETFAANVLRDQMSSAHPAGALVAAPILEAAGILHSTPILVMMPDDPALGEFRAEFKGLLGMIEERPRDRPDARASFAGASEIVNSDDLYDKLDKDPLTPLDSRAFLAARLIDAYIGDWDRHRDQWRWALVGTGGNRRWVPIPRDRDQAFVRFDGFLLSQARRTAPQLANFSSEFGSALGSTWNGRDLDRRFLTGLERPVWDSVALALKARLTDQVIADALRRLPPELYQLDAPRMERALKRRRDHIDRFARKYYDLLAARVDVYGSDKTDEASVVRAPSGDTQVSLAHNGTRYFSRNFHPHETVEVRVYLQGGDDRAIVNGESRRHPMVRLIGGGGDDTFLVTKPGGIKVYDDKGTSHAEGKGIKTKPWTWKPDSLNPRALPPRDWGRKTLLYATGYFGPDVQAVIGYGGHTDWFRFRRVPFGTRLDYKLEFSTGKKTFRGRLALTHQYENSGKFWEIDAMGSGIETIRWYGLGNETVQDITGNGAAFYRVSQDQLVGGVSFGKRFGAKSRFSIGPFVRWSQTDLNDKLNKQRFIATDRPFGTGRFGMGGLRAGLLLEGRDVPSFATRGASLSIQASGYPGIWDNKKPVTRVDAEATLALAPRGSWQPSLNFLVGGVKTTGTLPFFVAPTLGGQRTLRGYRPDRFAGEDAAYGSAELRVPVSRITILVPGQQGFFAFGDAGRVFVTNDHSNTWHSTVGGGVWLSFLSRGNVLLVGVGAPTKKNKKEGSLVLIGIGFPY